MATPLDIMACFSRWSKRHDCVRTILLLAGKAMKFSCREEWSELLSMESTKLYSTAIQNPSSGTRTGHSIWPIISNRLEKQRPKSVCILPLYRMKNDANVIPTRVSKALQYTQDKKGYIFTRTPQQRLSVTNIITSSRPRSSLHTASRSTLRLSPEASSTGMPSRDFDGTSSMTTLRSQTTESGSISLVPGVFKSKNPRPRIFVRYRQLSSEERVIEWLYKSCTHPLKTLPLL